MQTTTGSLVLALTIGVLAISLELAPPGDAKRDRARGAAVSVASQAEHLRGVQPRALAASGGAATVLRPLQPGVRPPALAAAVGL